MRPSTRSSTRAYSTIARWRRNSGRVRPPQGSRWQSWRRHHPRPAECRWRASLPHLRHLRWACSSARPRDDDVSAATSRSVARDDSALVVIGATGPRRDPARVSRDVGRHPPARSRRSPRAGPLAADLPRARRPDGQRSGGWVWGWDRQTAYATDVWWPSPPSWWPSPYSGYALSAMAVVRLGPATPPPCCWPMRCRWRSGSPRPRS